MALTKTPIELSSTPSIVDGGNATAITISSAELVTVANGLTLTDGNVVVANGHGIDFSATSGSGTSELLDDYEEGTWTPSLNGSGYTFGTHTGTYIKIGRVCTVVGKLVVSGVGTNTSNMGSLTGYPFAALNTTNQFQVGVAREITTTGRMYIVQVNVNTTTGGINSMDGVASGSNEIFTTGEYSFSLTYITT
tara:strand:+ start:172 stop:750 length:579 start_codon:yes stop_codon:yes gene_type:complete